MWARFTDPIGRLTVRETGGEGGSGLNYPPDGVTPGKWAKMTALPATTALSKYSIHGRRAGMSALRPISDVQVSRTVP